MWKIYFWFLGFDFLFLFHEFIIYIYKIFHCETHFPLLFNLILIQIFMFGSLACSLFLSVCLPEYFFCVTVCAIYANQNVFARMFNIVFQSAVSFSFCLSACLCVCLSVRVFVCPHVCLSVCPLFCLSTCLSVCLHVCVFGNLRVCLSVRMFVCLAVCVFCFVFCCLFFCSYIVISKIVRDVIILMISLQKKQVWPVLSASS